MFKKITFLIFSVFIISGLMAETNNTTVDLEKVVLEHYNQVLLNNPPVNDLKSNPKTIQGMWSWFEGFEGEFSPADLWYVISDKDKEFTWGRIDTHLFHGKYVLSSAGAINNSLLPGFDFNYIGLKKPIYIPKELKNKWAKLEFYLNLKLPEPIQFSFMPNGSVSLHFVIESTTHRHYFWTTFDQNTVGYEFVSIDLGKYLDVTKIKKIWFEFAYYSPLNELPPEVGAWIDDIKLRFHYWDPVIANFEASPLAGKAPLEVSFVNDFEGAPNHFILNFGDGSQLCYREPWNTRVIRKHIYTTPGKYDVTFKGWNEAWTDELKIPNLIYVDPVLEYCALSLLSAGETFPGDTWDNVIDHDIYGYHCLAAGKPGDAWAKFKIADDAARLVSKIRLLNDFAAPREYRTNCAKDVKISLSQTGAFAGEEVVINYTCTGLRGVWDEIPVVVAGNPVLAKFVKVEILSSIGAGAKYRELVEMQVMGTMPAPPTLPTLAAAAQPADFRIVRNYPNPFNPETTIQFNLEKASNVTLTIYNLQGQTVRTLANGELTAGAHNVRWDARDNEGVPVAGGVYLYKLTIENDSRPMNVIQKMMLMK